MSMIRAIPIWKQIIGLAYGFAVFLIMFRAGSPDQLWWWPGAAVFFLWAVAPIWIPLLYKPKMLLNGAILALIAGVSIYEYFMAMFGPGMRSTSALIFLFLPIYQWIAAVVVVVAGLGESHIRGKIRDR